ncbi:MAG TPA: nitrilase-related carbon-nitrogen hydrolase [Ignavibacteria bacterium]|nr:nitrilase-related carbon-nitrogen hydrolase [Ignavibacteria bacterium]
MKTGFLQFKPEFGNPEINTDRIKELISDAEFDLLVLPELANTGYLFTDKSELEELSEEIESSKFCDELKNICKEKNAYIVSGISERYKDKFYNSSVLVSPDGKIITYRKIHLFDREKLWFTPGDTPLQVHEIDTAENGKVKIGMMICFDWIFPETARTLALKGAQIICHPSNLVMSYCQTAMFTRALENHVFTITANRTGTEKRGDKELTFTGESVIVNTRGKYLCRGGKDTEEICIAEIDPSEALSKNISDSNDLFVDRREEFYEK